jgi:pimeloyl-ACP methyl ester carboxylesterase
MRSRPVSLILVLLALVGAVVLAGALTTRMIARHAQAAHPPVGRFVAVDGGRLHVIDAGPVTGPAAGTVVLLHGASGNAADMMLTLGTALASRYRVLAFDRPGQGWSERPGGAADASPARQAALIRQALHFLGVSKATIVGHSWSGALALTLALDHHEVTQALVLLGAVTHPWPGGIAWHYTVASQPWLAAPFTEVLSAPLGSLLLPSAVTAVFTPQDAPADYAARTGAALLLRPAAFRANAEDMEGLLAYVTALAPRYAEIRVPTIILHGDQDKVVWLDLHARPLQHAVAGAKLIVLEGAGHMPHHTEPARIIAQIDALAQIPTEPGAR